jgi:hypothetical protein
MEPFKAVLRRLSILVWTWDALIIFVVWNQCNQNMKMFLKTAATTTAVAAQHVPGTLATIRHLCLTISSLYVRTLGLSDVICSRTLHGGAKVYLPKDKLPWQDKFCAFSNNMMSLRARSGQKLWVNCSSHYVESSVETMIIWVRK